MATSSAHLREASRLRPLCCFWLALAVFSAALAAGDAPPPKPPPLPGLDVPPPRRKEEALPEVDWSAAKQSFVEDQGLILLSGSAWVRYKGAKLEADHIVFYRQTRELYAEGNIRLRLGESEIGAQAAYVDIEHDTGYLIDAVVRVSAPPDAAASATVGEPKKDKTEKREEVRQLAPVVKTATSFIRSRDPYGIYLDPADDPQARTNLVFKAARLIKRDRFKYTAEDAFVTTDDMVHPMYGVKAGEVEFYLMTEAEKEQERAGRRRGAQPAEDGKASQGRLVPHKIVARRARLNLMGFSLFPFPKIAYDLVKGYPYFQVNAGNSSRWGPYVLNRFGYNLGSGEDQLFDPTRVYLDLDERYRRGPGLGFEFDWETGRRPSEGADKTGLERGEGHLRVYTVDEIQTDREDARWRARRDLERRVQPKTDGFPRRDFDANLLFARRRKADDAGPPAFDLHEHRNEWRGMVDFQQHQPLKRFAGLDNLILDLRYSRQTDRDFTLEYFQSNYMKDNQPEALASVRKPGDNYSVELLYRANPQDFDGTPPRSPVDYGTFTGYEPALTYSLAPLPLPWGFYVAGEAQGARMKRYFEQDIYDQDDFDAARGYAQVDVTRPVKWGPLNFVPHLGTQQQLYSDSRDGGGTSQGAVTYGLDVTSRVYGLFPDFENDALGLQGMRHILEPRLSYQGVNGTRQPPENILDFDEVDDLTDVDKVTLALDQTFQTKRTTRENDTRNVNFAGFDMAVDYFPRHCDQRRLLHGDSLDLFRMDGFLRVVDIFKVDGSLGLSLEDSQVETASYGILIDPNTRWRLRLEERFNYGNHTRAITGSDQYRVRLEYQLSERWGMAFERISETRRSLLHHKGRQIERLTLTRSYGAVDASFTYAVDRNFGENAFFVSLRPVTAYRNVVVPSQDLLVASGEVSGEDAEAPEERNFDPFDLLKARKKKPGAGRGPNARPPVPARDQDVPVPPSPTPDKRVDRGGANTADSGLFRDPGEAAAASLFRDPNEAPPPKRPRKVDQDDWVVPPATPASTR